MNVPNAHAFAREYARPVYQRTHLRISPLASVNEIDDHPDYSAEAIYLFLSSFLVHIRFSTKPRGYRREIQILSGSVKMKATLRKLISLILCIFVLISSLLRARILPDFKQRVAPKYRD